MSSARHPRRGWRRQRRKYRRSDSQTRAPHTHAAVNIIVTAAFAFIDFQLCYYPSIALLLLCLRCHFRARQAYYADADEQPLIDWNASQVFCVFSARIGQVLVLKCGVLK